MKENPWSRSGATKSRLAQFPRSDSIAGISFFSGSPFGGLSHTAIGFFLKTVSKPMPHCAFRLELHRLG